MRIEPRDLYAAWQEEYTPAAIEAIVEGALAELPQEPADDIPMMQKAQAEVIEQFKAELGEAMREQLRKAPAELLITWGARLDGRIPDFEDYQEAA
jgi:hypothetical protein